MTPFVKQKIRINFLYLELYTKSPTFSIPSGIISLCRAWVCGCEIYHIFFGRGENVPIVPLTVL